MLPRRVRGGWSVDVYRFSSHFSPEDEDGGNSTQSVAAGLYLPLTLKFNFSDLRELFRRMVKYKQLGKLLCFLFVPTPWPWAYPGVLFFLSQLLSSGSSGMGRSTIASLSCSKPRGRLEILHNEGGGVFIHLLGSVSVLLDQSPLARSLEARWHGPITDTATAIRRIIATGIRRITATATARRITAYRLPPGLPAKVLRTAALLPSLLRLAVLPALVSRRRLEGRGRARCWWQSPRRVVLVGPGSGGTRTAHSTFGRSGQIRSQRSCR